ncbi:hypothetical protein D7D52_33935 [Nocardia yunnanensis]|uniref:HTH cro/C1-type domain-containing protein n=1 Tax=Nocardia yunnanensis TaxID=2382165 RepID=A0A386ZLG4_9NOCA|nr:hypothetical protein [Nocardia yunnanensis]AYF77994.1 hypothetical protein D7D52_33935 [Nocardia yunnanensis]
MHDRLKVWVEELTGGDSTRAMAVATGIPQATLARHLTQPTPPVETLIEIARAYNANPVEVQVIAGIITEAEAQRAGSGSAIREATTRQLLTELLRRDKEAEETARRKPSRGEVGARLFR